MASPWPPSLPQIPLYQGRERSVDRAISSQPDWGPRKIRLRFTAAPIPVSLSFVLTLAQVDTLDVFYDTTLGGGAEEFDWLHPRTGAAVSVRFKPGAIPSYTNISFELYKTILEFEIMP